MLRTVGWMAVLCLPVLLLAGPALAQKEKDAAAQKDKDKDKDPDKEKATQWVTVGKVVAKVAAVYEDKRKLRLQVPVPEIDMGQLQALNNAKAALARARDVNAARSAQQQIQQAQAKLYKITYKDVDVQAIDDVIVRMKTPRLEYDDKGRPKKLTKEELKEAKGEGELAKLDGYKAEFSDLQTEQIIQVTVVRKKGAPAPKPKAPAVKKGKGKDMDADIDALADEKTPQVSFIMIVQQPMAK
jgi:hypothetical protein